MFGRYEMFWMTDIWDVDVQDVGSSGCGMLVRKCYIMISNNSDYKY